MEFDATYSLVAMTVTPQPEYHCFYKDVKRGCHLNTISGVFTYAFMYVHILYCHIIYFHLIYLVPSPSFLYSKETKGLADPPLLRGCLAHEKGKRENERKHEASRASFTEC